MRIVIASDKFKGTLTGAEVDGVPVELTRGTDFGRDVSSESVLRACA